MNNKNYLLLFSIGPVQGLISQARKTSDLFAGSALLSELSKTVIKELNKAGTVIYPHVDKNGIKSDSLPNRILCMVNGTSSAEVKRFASEVENKVKKRLGELFSGALVTGLKKASQSKQPQDRFDAQLGALLNLNWLALPCSGSYKDDYKRLMTSFVALKRTVEFGQFEERGRKCSLCGERNVLFCKEGMTGKMSLKPLYNELDAKEAEEIKLYNSSLLEVPENALAESEGLCAVCFLKRFYKREEEKKDGFPSTTELAILDVKERLDNRFKSYFELFTSPFNYQFYFEENITHNYIKKHSYELKEQSKIEEPIELFNSKIKPSLKTEDIKLKRHYALIRFDGDSMGRWLSGNYLLEESRLEEFHSALSKALANFADEAVTLIEKEKLGRAVYAGGDDFLGLINLNGLFSFLKELRKRFKDLVNGPLKDFVKEGKKLTFSAGIVIAHYKVPLNEVIKRSKYEESGAKELDGKNGIGMAFMTKSGNLYSCRFRYERLELMESLVRGLSLEKPALSANFINVFSREFALFKERGAISFEGYERRSKMIKSELKRLMKRACTDDTRFIEHRALYDKLADYLCSLVEDKSGDRITHDLEAFTAFLQLGAKIAGEPGVIKKEVANVSKD